MKGSELINLFFVQGRRRSFLPGWGGEPIPSRLGLSLWSLRRLVPSDCKADVGESGSGRFVLCVPWALTPGDAGTGSSGGVEFVFGGLRRLIVSWSPKGLADRSGIIRFLAWKAEHWAAGESLSDSSSELSS